MTPTIKIFRIWDPFFTGAGAPPPARTYAERLARRWPQALFHWRWGPPPARTYAERPARRWRFFTGAGAPPPARTYAERLARARRRRFFTGRYSSRCSPVLPVPPI